MNKGSFGLRCFSAATNDASRVVLFSCGWQLPHVRPLPPKVSRKKMSAPAQISALTKPEATRGSRAQASSRCWAVRLVEMVKVFCVQLTDRLYVATAGYLTEKLA